MTSTATATTTTTPTTAFTTALIRSRYEELAALVTDVKGKPASRLADSAQAACRLAYEARLLDDERFEEWADLWADDAVLWVPIGSDPHPATDQSLFLDDRRRILERVQWRRDPSAWGQNPLSCTNRMVSAVEAWPHNSGLITRSAIIINEYRRGRHQQLSGWQIHELVGDSLQQRSKILILPQLELGVRNPSFIL